MALSGQIIRRRRRLLWHRTAEAEGRVTSLKPISRPLAVGRGFIERNVAGRFGRANFRIRVIRSPARRSEHRLLNSWLRVGRAPERLLRELQYSRRAYEHPGAVFAIPPNVG